MKTLRVWLFLLLAVLLPLRGAVAGAMLCAVPASQAEVAVAGHHMPDGGEVGHSHAHHSDALTAEHGDEGDAASAHDCNLCVSFCSVTPLVSAPATLPLAQAASELYPRFSAPVPRFLSGGQERPPRTV